MSLDPLNVVSIGLILVGMCGVGLTLYWRPVVHRRDRFARRLGLNRSQRRLLRTLSDSLGETDPLPLLLGQGCFEQAVAGAELDERSLVAVEQLRNHDL